MLSTISFLLKYDMLHGLQLLGTQAFLILMRNKYQSTHLSRHHTLSSPFLQPLAFSSPSVRCLRHHSTPCKSPSTSQRWKHSSTASWPTSLTTNPTSLPLPVATAKGSPDLIFLDSTFC